MLLFACPRSLMISVSLLLLLLLLTSFVTLEFSFFDLKHSISSIPLGNPN